MKKMSDLKDRALWTLAQAALGLVAVYAAGVPVAYAPVVAAVLSVAKTVVKGHLDERASSEG